MNTVNKRKIKRKFLSTAISMVMMAVVGTVSAAEVTLSLSDFVIFSGGGGSPADAGEETQIGGHSVINGNIGSNQDLYLQGNPILPNYPALLNGSAYAGGDLFFGQDLTVGSTSELREVVANNEAFISGGTLADPVTDPLETWIDGATIYGTLDALTATVNGTVTGAVTTGASADTFALITMPAATSFTAGGTNHSYSNDTVTLVPDTYGTLALTGDNNITLLSGDYYFDAITTAAGSNNNLYIDLTSGQPINVYVVGVLDFDTQDNMLWVKGPTDTTWELIKDRPDLAGLIYWETHDQFLLGGSSIWGGTVYSRLSGGIGIKIAQYINYTGAVYAFDSILILDHGNWNYVPLTVDAPAPSIDIEKYTNGQDADTPTGPILTEGDVVTWEYVVTNTGNVPLSNIIVTDDQGVTPIYVSGDDGDNILQPQEIWIYQANSVAVVGQYSNLGTATGTPPAGDNVSDSDPSHYFAEAANAPAIDIEKSTNGQDADAPTGPILTEGDAVTWEYVVTNTGNVPLNNIIVADDQGVVPVYVSGDDGDDILQPQESWIYQANGIAVIGQYSNLGTATGTPPAGDDVTDSDPSHYLGQIDAAPAIDIEKSTNGEDADEPTGPELIVGNLVTWEYVVANTGNVTLSNVIVTDNQAGVNPAFDFEIAGNSDGSFDPGEIWLFKATGLAVLGQYANIGTATGTSPAGTIVTDSDPSHYLGLYWAFTPGFWKNNTRDKGKTSHDAWKYTAYTTDVLLGAVFDSDCLDDYKLKGKTFDEYNLLQALNFKGGDDLKGALEILLRAAAASLLNASFHEEMGNPDGVYPYTVDEVIALVNEAICSGDRDTMLDLYEQLDWINNGVHYIEW